MKIPDTQAETHPLNELLTISNTSIVASIHFVVNYVRLFELVYITNRHVFLPIWKCFFSVIGLQSDHQLHLQAVNRHLFNQLLYTISVFPKIDHTVTA